MSGRNIEAVSDIYCAIKRSAVWASTPDTATMVDSVALMSHGFSRTMHA